MRDINSSVVSAAATEGGKPFQSGIFWKKRKNTKEHQYKTSTLYI